MVVEQGEQRSEIITRLLKDGHGRYTLGQQQTLAEIGFECQCLEVEGLPWSRRWLNLLRQAARQHLCEPELINMLKQANQPASRRHRSETTLEPSEYDIPIYEA